MVDVRVKVGVVVTGNVMVADKLGLVDNLVDVKVKGVVVTVKGEVVAVLGLTKLL